MNLYTTGFRTLLVFLFLLVTSHNSFGQIYGLGISPPHFSKDNSTALDLSPNGQICLDGNFEVSFEVSLLSTISTNSEFGYIFRIIEDNDRNFDFLYNFLNHQSPFKIIVGDSQTKLGLNIPLDRFLKQWNKITIKFDSDKDRLIVSYGLKTYVEGGLRLKKKGCYKLLFGANSDKKFKTNEALMVKIRNIRITKDGVAQYYWPLDEQQGEVVHELINGQNGRVKNPFWMASLYQKWKKIGDFIVKGPASTAFNSKEESLYITGEDSLFTFSLRNSVLSARVNRDKLINTNTGNQSIYSPINNKIYHFLPYMKAIGRYSLTSQKWEKKLPPWEPTNYYNVNKVISQHDSSMYVFGGYGVYTFNNAVKRLPLKTEQWENVKSVGNFFTPRYLSALGSNRQGDTVYILGGYGSVTGSEMVNPKNIYNMMRFTTRDKRFKKLYDLKHEGEDFAFANSLVIDSSSKTYYGLVFPQRKYNTNLRLIAGSLKNGSYKLIGSAIPYQYYYPYSFADLFYGQQSKKFIAVTLLTKAGNRTIVRIYTLQGPPLDTNKRYLATQKDNSILWILLSLVVALLSGGLILYFYLWKKKHHVNYNSQIGLVEPDFKPNISVKNSIFLFGDLQIFDLNGTDITKLFTPLLKELFLVLLVHSVKNGRGLHMERLDEMLWSGKSEKSVRNNRAVNIVKLKSILERIEHCQLLKDADYWKIEVDYDFWYIDYQNYLNLIEAKKKLDEEQIKLLFELTRRGNFLSNHNYEWLDQFKAEISNEVIDVFLTYANSTKPYHPEFLIQIASFIFYFDPVSEEAMVIKCKALASLGKHSLAKQAFDAFVKDYRSIYNEDFDKTFNQII